MGFIFLHPDIYVAFPAPKYAGFKYYWLSKGRTLQTRNATYREDNGPRGRIHIYRNIIEKYIT
jgi:hypothetical protein